MQVDHFNALDEATARSTVHACLAVERWVHEVVGARPYTDLAGLLRQACASAENLSDAELAAALTRHPRIGERLTADDAEAATSTAEQSGVDAADRTVTSRLREGNQRYEHRFGRVFLAAPPAAAATRSSASSSVALPTTTRPNAARRCQSCARSRWCASSSRMRAHPAGNTKVKASSSPAHG